MCAGHYKPDLSAPNILTRHPSGSTEIFYRQLRLAASLFYGVRLFSQAAQGIFIVALFIAAGSGDHLAAGLSGVLIAMMAASVLTGIPGGMIADRLGPGAALATGALARAAVVAVAFISLGTPAGAIAIALAYSTASQVFSAAELAFVRELDAARPARGHALLVVFQYAGQAAGLMVLAPILILVGGVAVAVGGALVLYVVAFGLAAWLAAVQPGAEPDGLPHRSLSLGPTLRFFGAEPTAAYAAGVLTFFELVLKAMVVAIPVFLASEMHMGRPALAVLGGMTVSGGLAGFWLAAVMRPRQSEALMRPLMVGIVIVAGLLAIASHAAFDDVLHVVLVACMAPLAATVGLCLTLAPITARSVLTQRAPLHHQARVFATQGFGTNVVVMIPLALAGIGTELAGSGATFWLLALTGMGAVAAMELLLVRVPGQLALEPAFEPVDARN